MTIEGELAVTLHVAGGRVERAEARAVRPRVASALFDGRRPDEAAPMAGALFAICGRAQAIAAAAAVEAAEGRVPDAATTASRGRRIAAELVQEHLGRLLVDGPALAGHDPEAKHYVRARALLAPWLAESPAAPGREAAETLREWAQAVVFGVAPSDFLTMDSIPSFLNWIRGAGTPVAGHALALVENQAALGASETAFLESDAIPALVADIGRALEREPAFEEAPHREGEARETGALARGADHPLVADAIATIGRGVGARLVARLVEVAQALEDLAGAPSGRHGALAQDGWGLGWAQTARGLLVHRVRVAGGKLEGYRIVAPTEWNFHPDGAFARGARGLADDARLEASARAIVGSLDPCVGVRLEVARA